MWAPNFVKTLIDYLSVGLFIVVNKKVRNRLRGIIMGADFYFSAEGPKPVPWVNFFKYETLSSKRSHLVGVELRHMWICEKFRIKWDFSKLPVGILQNKIRQNGNSLDENNFPECVRDAYKDCNSPIYEYFCDKFGLDPDLKRYFHVHNLCFGQNLTKCAMKLLLDCLNIQWENLL